MTEYYTLQQLKEYYNSRQFLETYGNKKQLEFEVLVQRLQFGNNDYHYSQLD